MKEIPTEQEVREFFQDATLMDNEFMGLCFETRPECAQVAIRIILGAPDLVVQSVTTEKTYAHPAGRGIRTDIKATDTEGRHYAVEMQNSDDGLLALRASYYLSTLRAASLAKNENFDKLPETYVIFITRTDTFRKGRIIYRFERYDAEADLLLGDKAHIIFVNGEQQGTGSDMERFLHDVFCRSHEEMLIPELANAVRYLKTTEEGQKFMNEKAQKILEAREARCEAKVRMQTALRMLADGLALDKIAKYSGLALEEVRTLAAEAARKANSVPAALPA
ncbi:MAG: Rpn family recombination-promoting nuclease/putative transposase [Actinomycetaceae bacterium]|nr:Rpn family recombination-promoting nuclease/putative transposase [Actinomycetaceae bacterium]